MLKVLLVVLTILYPGLVYLGLTHFRPGLFGLLIGAMVLLRLGVLSREERGWMVVPLVLLIAYSILVAWTDSELLVRIYPAIVNLIMLAVFGWTLFHPPSLIECLSRSRGMPISPGGELYTRRLTMVWCVFFVTNAVIAGYTAWASSLAIWALYNGFFVYLVMGVLLGGEMLYRRRYKRHVASLGDQAPPP